MPAMNIVFLILRYSVAVGLIAGLLWGWALNWELTISLLVGIGIASVITALLSLYFFAGIAGGRTTATEAISAVGMFVGVIALLLIGSGLVALLVRVAFF